MFFATEIKAIKYKLLLIFGLVAIIFWVGDTLLDYLFFYSGATFLDLLLLDIPGHEIYSRLLLIMATIIAGLVIGNLLTRQKQSDDMRLLNESTLQTLILSMRDLVFVADMQKRYVQVFGEWQETLAIEPETMLGQTTAEVFGSTEAQPHEVALNLALAGQNIVYEWSLDIAAGSRYIQTSLSPLYNHQQEIVGALGVGRNITEWVEAEKMLAQRATQLTLINSMAGDIASVMALDDLLELVAQLIQNRFDYHHVALFLIAGNELHLKAVAGRYSAYLPADHVQPLDVGINGWVARHGQKILANDVNQELRYTSLIAEHSVTRAELCLPIIVAGTTFGVLDVQSSKVDAFGQNDVIALEALTNQLAIAVENARLYEALQAELAEREAREEKLRKFSYAIEQSSSVVLITDVAGNIEYVNPKFTQVTGYTPAEVQGKNPSLLKSGETSLQEYKQLWETIKSGNEWRGIFHNRKKDNSLFWESASISPIKNEKGEITHFLAAKEDITEQVQTEKALQQSEERFRQVIVSISDHIYVTEITPTGRRLNRYLSPHVSSLTGYPRQEFVNSWSFWSQHVIHPEDRQLAADQLAQLERGEDSQSEYRLIRADGEIIWVRDSARVQQDDGAIVIYGLVSDITDSKQVEERIRKLNDELEQRVLGRTRELSALYAVTAVGSQALTLDTMLERSLERSLTAMKSNEGYIHLLEKAGQTLVLVAQHGLEPGVIDQSSDITPGYRLANWVLEHSEPLLIRRLDQHFSTSDRNVDKTYGGAPIRASGQTIGVLSVIRTADDQFGVEEMALLGSIADQVGVMVENARLRRQAEQAAIMEERERLARELHDSVTQSLYSLTLLAGGGQRLARAGTLENIDAYFADLGEIAQQALKEMRLLVHELRPTVLEKEGLLAALQQRLDAVEGRSGVKARLLVEALPQHLPAHVEEGLYRITLEALNNTLKHANATKVTVKLYNHDDNLILEVRDNGNGFNPNALKDAGGMGLVSLQERAGMMNGVLSINSKVNEGTCVKVTILPQKGVRPGF